MKERAMYNGIGLPTARGSGTNGYVQKNLAHMFRSKEKVDYRRKPEERKQYSGKEFFDSLSSKTSVDSRPPERRTNEEILEHERRHRIEVKCTELRDMMEEEGYGEEVIQEKVSKFRAALLDRESIDMRRDGRLINTGRKTMGTHESNHVANSRDFVIRKALQIREFDRKRKAKQIEMETTEKRIKNKESSSEISGSSSMKEEEGEYSSSTSSDSTDCSSDPESD
ncbi:hypothetical protein ACOME3_007920 [Neoechinorhynchus agilis]